MSESDGTFPLPFKPPDTAIIKADAKPVVITLAAERWMDAVAAIQDTPDAIERAYMARQLIQCTLSAAR
jgi:hypothetical protein